MLGSSEKPGININPDYKKRIIKYIIISYFLYYLTWILTDMALAEPCYKKENYV